MTFKAEPPARELHREMMTQMPSTSQVRIFESWLSFDLQRGLALLGIGERVGDLAHLGVHAGGGDDDGAAAVYDRGTHVAPCSCGRRAGHPSEPSLRLMMSMNLLTGTLSPVRAASSIFMLALMRMRPSAGIASPASRITMSPTTRSSLWMVTIFPSRSTLDVAADICCRASMAFSALLS